MPLRMSLPTEITSFSSGVRYTAASLTACASTSKPSGSPAVSWLAVEARSASVTARSTKNRVARIVWRAEASDGDWKPQTPKVLKSILEFRLQQTAKVRHSRRRRGAMGDCPETRLPTPTYVPPTPPPRLTLVNVWVAEVDKRQCNQVVRRVPHEKRRLGRAEMCLRRHPAEAPPVYLHRP